jgi:hypothetical protein
MDVLGTSILPDGTEIPELLGWQRPQYWTVPDRHRTETEGCRSCQNPNYRGIGCGEYVAQDVLEWSHKQAGYVLDDWQSWTLTESMGVRPDGKWAARQAGLIMPRQNGKNSCLEVRELGGLYYLNEELIIHTAHELLSSRLLRSISVASGIPSRTTRSSARGSKGDRSPAMVKSRLSCSRQAR